MTWVQGILQRLAAEDSWRYCSRGAVATEPTSLAALALAGHGNHIDAEKARRALAHSQAPNGSLGVTAANGEPTWPTAMAILSWCMAGDFGERSHTYHSNIATATAWILTVRGETMSRSDHIGHDTTLTGWPWVEGMLSSSWVEPTAWNILALKAAGKSEHPRTREGVLMLIDRMLPAGGWNYGNTTVFGQTLRPQAEPTGLALAALANERDHTRSLELSLSYLSRSLSEETTAISLAYALFGLAAHERTPPWAPRWIEAAAWRSLMHVGPSLKHALLALAVLDGNNPILRLQALQ